MRPFVYESPSSVQEATSRGGTGFGFYRGRDDHHRSDEAGSDESVAVGRL